MAFPAVFMKACLDKFRITRINSGVGQKVRPNLLPSERIKHAPTMTHRVTHCGVHLFDDRQRLTGLDRFILAMAYEIR